MRDGGRDPYGLLAQLHKAHKRGRSAGRIEGGLYTLMVCAVIWLTYLLTLGLA